MVLRMSMEEERLRQQKAAGASGAATTAGGAPAAAAAPMEEDEEALLAQAIALSMQENAEAPMADVPAADATPASAAAATPAAASAAAPAAAAPASAADIDLAMQDPDFINSLLAGVSGADGQSVDVSVRRIVRGGERSNAAWDSCSLRFAPCLLFVHRTCWTSSPGAVLRAETRTSQRTTARRTETRSKSGRAIQRLPLARPFIAFLPRRSVVISSALLEFQINNKQLHFKK